MYDAVMILAKAMDDLATIKGFRVDPVSCRQRGAWMGGREIVKYLKKVCLLYFGQVSNRHQF